MPKFHEVVGAILALLAVGAVIYAAIVQNNGEAQGALVAIVVAANSFFLRGKLQNPSDSGTTATTDTTTTVSMRPSPTRTITSTTTDAPAPTPSSAGVAPPMSPTPPPPAIDTGANSP